MGSGELKQKGGKGGSMGGWNGKSIFETIDNSAELELVLSKCIVKTR